MGCCNTRDLSKDSNIESVIYQSEVSLDFHNYSSEYLDRAIHRNSTQMKMSEQQFSRFFESLKKIESKDEVKDFFRLFYDMKDHSYETRLISTFGILMGQGSYDEKASLIFDNYDDESTRILTKDQIKNMILDIFYISCICLPAYAARKTLTSVKCEIEQYKQKLGIMKNGICNHLVNLIFEDLEQDQLRIDEFRRLMAKREIRGILEAQAFRKTTKRIFMMIERAALTADFYMKEEDEYKKKVCMLGLSGSNHRNSIH